MPRGYFVGIGLVIAAVFGAFAVLTAAGGSASLLDVAAPLATALAGVLIAAAGLVDHVPIGRRRLRWFHLVGTAILLHALATVAFSVQSATASGAGVVSPDVIVSASLALIFLWIGVDFLRGGVHHDLSVFE